MTCTLGCSQGSRSLPGMSVSPSSPISTPASSTFFRQQGRHTGDQSGPPARAPGTGRWPAPALPHHAMARHGIGLHEGAPLCTGKECGVNYPGACRTQDDSTAAMGERPESPRFLVAKGPLCASPRTSNSDRLLGFTAKIDRYIFQNGSGTLILPTHGHRVDTRWCGYCTTTPDRLMAARPANAGQAAIKQRAWLKQCVNERCDGGTLREHD